MMEFQGVLSSVVDNQSRIALVMRAWKVIMIPIDSIRFS
jgi:hypothetical protein